MHVIDIVIVSGLQDDRRLREIAIMHCFVNVNASDQPFCFLGMVAQEVCDNEEAQDSDEHYCIRGSRSTHIPHGNTEDNEDWNYMHVNPENSIGSLTVIVKSTVFTQELTISC